MFGHSGKSPVSTPSWNCHPNFFPSQFFWKSPFHTINVWYNVSKSREKSYGTNTQTAPKQQKQQYFFLLCLGASLCNSGPLAGVKMSPEVFWVRSKMVPVRWTKYPAVPTGLAVGTNPSGLPSGDHRWEV